MERVGSTGQGAALAMTLFEHVTREVIELLHATDHRLSSTLVGWIVHGWAKIRVHELGDSLSTLMCSHRGGDAAFIARISVASHFGMRKIQDVKYKKNSESQLFTRVIRISYQTQFCAN